MQRLSDRILSAPLGKTHLFSAGQAGFIIKSAKGELLGIDLYLSDYTERFEGDHGFRRLLPMMLFPGELEFDAVICTHPHADHFDMDSVPWFVANHRTKLICSVECEKLVKQLQLEYYNDQITYAAPGDQMTVGSFEIDFVECDHGEAAPDAFGVIVNVDDKKIYEVGDSCLRLDWAISLPRDLDVLIGPINGAYGNMNEDDLPQLAEVIHPKLTIPCHYGMFASHHGDPGLFYENMMKKKLPCRLMQQGEGIVI